MERKAAAVAYVRNFIFGVEDSLVSTVGLLSGIAVTGMAPAQIFATGVILIFVEAISMAAGSFLSEASVEEYETRSTRTSRRSYGGSFIMFFSYFISGFIPLLPYLLFTGSTAFWGSITLSVVSLIILGIVSARLSRTRALVTALRMAIIGGLAILVGVVVGTFIS